MWRLLRLPDHGQRSAVPVDGGGESGLVSLTDWQSYLGFVTLTLLAFGISFLFPVVIVFLNVVGVLSAEKLIGLWRAMIVGIAIFAAVLTPSTDPYTFSAMAIPLWILYGVCILIAGLRRRLTRRRAAADPLTALADDVPSTLEASSGLR